METQEPQRPDAPSPRFKGVLRVPPALRYPAYRTYWLGTLGSVSGYQIFLFTQFVLVYYLTGSYIYLGLVGLANAVPAIGLSLFGGVVADKVDRRKLIMVAQAATGALMFTLATLTLGGVVEVWHVAVIVFGAGAVQAFDNPARQAFYPRLLDRSVMTSGVALNSAIWQGMRIAGPAIAGIIVAHVGDDGRVGMAAALFLASAGFWFMGGVMYTLKVAPVESPGRLRPLSDIKDGLRFVLGSTVIAFLIMMAYFNNLFGTAYIPLMPAIATELLEVGADRQGWLLSAAGAGGLLVTVFLGSRRTIGNRSLLLIGGATLYGSLVAAMALTAESAGSYPLALVIMFGIGASLSMYMVPLQTSLQLMVPDNMRGRVMGLFSMAYAFQPLAATQAGFVATFLGVHIAIAIGGGLVAAFALGPALLNARIRSLNAEIRQTEALAAAG